MATPMRAVAVVLHARRPTSARARPASTEVRWIGSDRNRSNRPDSMSAATPTADSWPPKRMPLTRKPGTMKST
jgi:hypothetical protein